MTKTEKLVWRLNKLPTTDELRDLVKDKIITQEEARGVLFKTETSEDVDIKELQSEIKFLRELVQRLADNKTTIVEQIRYIEKPYFGRNWFEPYTVWCSTTTNAATPGISCTAASSGNYTYTALQGNDDNVTLVNSQFCDPVSSASFTDIKTF